MKQLGKISGIAYVMIFLAGFYANFAILESLIDSSSPSITTANFINNHSQFGNGLIGFMVMLFFDLVLVWATVLSPFYIVIRLGMASSASKHERLRTLINNDSDKR